MHKMVDMSFPTEGRGHGEGFGGLTPPLTVLFPHLGLPSWPPVGWAQNRTEGYWISPKYNQLAIKMHRNVQI